MIHITGNLLRLRDKFWIEDKSSRHQRLRITWKIAWKFFELNTATKKTLKMPFSLVPSAPPGNAYLRRLCLAWHLTRESSAAR